MSTDLQHKSSPNVLMREEVKKHKHETTRNKAWRDKRETWLKVVQLTVSSNSPKCPRRLSVDSWRHNAWTQVRHRWAVSWNESELHLQWKQVRQEGLQQEQIFTIRWSCTGCLMCLLMVGQFETVVVSNVETKSHTGLSVTSNHWCEPHHSFSLIVYRPCDTFVLTWWQMSSFCWDKKQQ